MQRAFRGEIYSNGFELVLLGLVVCAASVL